MDKKNMTNKSDESKFKNRKNKPKVKVYTNKRHKNTSDTELIAKLKDRYENVIFFCNFFRILM